MGFEIDASKVKRAGLDYWPSVILTEHASLDEFLTGVNPPKCWLIETTGEHFPWEVRFGPSDALIFGSETKGLPGSVIEQFEKSQIVKLPMRTTAVRSLNLSNTVTAVAYEALRQNADTFLQQRKVKV